MPCHTVTSRPVYAAGRGGGGAPTARRPCGHSGGASSPAPLEFLQHASKFPRPPAPTRDVRAKRSSIGVQGLPRRAVWIRRPRVALTRRVSQHWTLTSPCTAVRLCCPFPAGDLTLSSLPSDAGAPQWPELGTPVQLPQGLRGAGPVGKRGAVCSGGGLSPTAGPQKLSRIHHLGQAGPPGMGVARAGEPSLPAMPRSRHALRVTTGHRTRGKMGLSHRMSKTHS